MRLNPQVALFRENVDQVIGQQVNTCEAQRRFWPGYDTRAKDAGLEFVSVDQREGRNSIFGFGESHLWGVAEENVISYAHRAGALAVVSYAEDLDSLHRIIAVKGPSQMFRPTVKLELSEEQMELATQWVQSPHLKRLAFLEAVQLTGEEKGYLDGVLAKQTQDQLALSRSLDEIARRTNRY